MNFPLFLAIFFLATTVVLTAWAFPTADRDGGDGQEPQQQQSAVGSANPSSSPTPTNNLNSAVGSDYAPETIRPKPHKLAPAFRGPVAKKHPRPHRHRRVGGAGALHRGPKRRRPNRGRGKKRGGNRRNRWRKTRRGRKQRRRKHRRPNGAQMGLNGANNAVGVQMGPSQDPTQQPGFDPQLAITDPGQQQLGPDAQFLGGNIDTTPELAGLMAEAEAIDSELPATDVADEPQPAPPPEPEQPAAPAEPAQPSAPQPSPASSPPALPAPPGPENTPGLYQLLGISPQASVEEIRTAYKKAALRLHPDRNADPNATRQFQEMKEAYEVLSNPAKREKYDQGGMEEVAKWNFGDTVQANPQ